MSASRPMDVFAVNVEAGDGAVARWDVGVAVAGGDDDLALDLMAALQATLGDEPSSGEIIDALRSDSRFNSDRADLAVAVSAPDGLRVFVRGAAEVRTETDELIAGPEPVERHLPDPRALWMGTGGPPLSQGHPVLDLRRGIVPGRGVVLHRPMTWPPPPADAEPSARGAAGGADVAGVDAVDATNPGQAAPPAPDQPAPPAAPAPAALAAPAPPMPPGTPDVASQSVPSGPFEAVDWADPVETRQPLPVATKEQSASVDVRESADQVLGIRCSRDHFNNPKASYCQVCGISMIHLTHRLEPGPRPTLGFVVFADGATYAVDRPYLIGRKPRPGPNSGLTPLATQDQTQSVSREHGELRLDGWDVHYVDLGSTNGSFVWSPTAQTWTPLRPREPLTLTSGTSISVGRMTFVFQGASKEVEAR